MGSQNRVQPPAQANAKLIALARRVATLNPKCAEIGAGMLATLVAQAQEALVAEGLASA